MLMWLFVIYVLLSSPKLARFALTTNLFRVSTYKGYGDLKKV